MKQYRETRPPPADRPVLRLTAFGYGPWRRAEEEEEKEEEGE